MNKDTSCCQVIKVFNNNVLWVKEDDSEKVLYGNGIGFGKKTGDKISDFSSITKVFSLEGHSDKYRQLASFVDDELMGLCEEIIYFIFKELNEELDQKIHVSLTDHIAFTVKRLKANDEIFNPFLIETETLYKEEFEIAEKAVKIIEERLNLTIPKGEIGFITLHIHSARKNGKLSNTIKYAFITNKISDFLEKRLNIKIDKKSLDYARFITHVRFAMERLMKNSPIGNEFYDFIISQHKDAYKVAEEAAKIIENELHIKVVKEEIAYIAIHIEKLKSSQ
ncbi:MAG: PRD domain-containing protein [Bacillota bacterium]|nr:PRD domain-containing protein [Bacillota bacterium]